MQAVIPFSVSLTDIWYQKVSCIRDKLKEVSNFKCCKCGCYQTDIVEEFLTDVWYQKCSCIRDNLKEVSNFKCWTFRQQQTDIMEECQIIELIGDFHEIVETFFITIDTVGFGGSPCDSIKTKIRSQ